jgi:hypothetical protein
VRKSHGNNVLLGTGREQHPVNKLYRRVVDENKARYLAALIAN